MTLASRWSSFPRAVRWCVIFVIGVVVYLVAIEPAIDAYNGLSARADSNMAVLGKLAAAKDQVSQADSDVQLGVKQFGLVDYPADAEKDAGGGGLNKAIDQILRRNGVEGQTSTTRTVTMPKGPLSDRAGQNYRVERVTKTIEFNAHPADVAKVIAELEQTPSVSTISNLQLRQVESRDKPGRLMNASITVESWVLAKKGGGR